MATGVLFGAGSWSGRAAGARGATAPPSPPPPSSPSPVAAHLNVGTSFYLHAIPPTTFGNRTPSPATIDPSTIDPSHAAIAPPSSASSPTPIERQFLRLFPTDEASAHQGREPPTRQGRQPTTPGRLPLARSYKPPATDHQGAGPCALSCADNRPSWHGSPTTGAQVFVGPFTGPLAGNEHPTGCEKMGLLG
ncbi:LOW QUALITY PROTEIN: hypothetical protein SORBI_3007G013601 [Sorghum bicolor]|uniref:Uncharacterized protein n=1 Tax=Sorghum bicolor TaxID=4558 RepID=A0A1B6PFB8_SORBI|nr:LOW QUALITY PROTEIN: hypothetical protein SORBI_3007G013601 [Sorghum bicolor]